MSRIAVIQCSKCGTIVGDTTSDLIEECNSKTITLTAPVNVHVISSDAQEGEALESIVRCNSCFLPLGHCPSSNIWQRKDLVLFAFRTNKVRLYYVNPTQSGECKNPSVPREKRQSFGGVDSCDDSHSAQHHLVKIQNMLLLFHERLESLEKMSASRCRG